MFFRRKKDEKEEVSLPVQGPLPKHVALDLEGVGSWAEKSQIDFEEAYHKSFYRALQLIEKQVALNIPILTFFVMSPGLRKTEQAEPLMKQFASFLTDQQVKKRCADHKIKVSVLGKWYDLPQYVVSAIRIIGEDTKDYDAFFVNFCVNYDGQDEILDAMKLLGRQIRAGQLDPDLLKKEMMKDSLYSSDFIPPDVIIRNGNHQRLSSLLLWDSPGAKIVFSGKLFPELSVDEFEKLVS